MNFSYNKSENKDMSNYIVKIKLFFITALALFMLCFLPIKCFAQNNISEAESRVFREKLVTETKKYIGAPYVRGATGPNAFDCSGLIYTVAHDSIKYQLPRTVKAMYSYVKIVPDSEREPGDLVFFRTTGDGSISHVGLYIGNGQFISAVSDGPNTGVIVSSVREAYWKSHYAACGKFLPSANYNLMDSDYEKNDVAESEGADDSGDFVNRLFLMGTFTGDWSLFTEEQFMPNFRGISSEADIVYKGKTLSPGAGLMLRWNYGVGAFQLPVVFSLFFGNYVRAYAGPVFTIGECTSPGTSKEIKSSIFPGIMGITFNTPSFTKGQFKVQIIQDICYTIFNSTSGAALSPLRSSAAGLEFCTGVRVTFPMSKLFKK